MKKAKKYLILFVAAMLIIIGAFTIYSVICFERFYTNLPDKECSDLSGNSDFAVAQFYAITHRGSYNPIWPLEFHITWMYARLLPRDKLQDLYGKLPCRWGR